MKERRAKADLTAETLRAAEENFFALPFVAEGEVFFVYRSFGSEMPTTNLIKKLQSAGKTVCLPRIEGSDMVPVLWKKDTPMSENRFGIEEPTGEAFLGKIDVAVTPLLAVDRYGNRLGYGGGYYDRFFVGKTLKKVGFCYDFQIADEVFFTPFDVRLDAIVTEKRTIDTGEEK